MNNFYILYGEEKTLINEEKNKIIRNILGNEIDNNISKYNMLQTSINEVIEDACTISLLSDKKVIVCSDCFFLTGINNNEIDNNIDELIKYLNNYNEDTYIILIVNNAKLDERKKIVKLLKKIGIVKEFNKLKDNEVVRYAKDYFEENGYKIDLRSLRLLISRVENNLELLLQEINKLMIYKIEEKEIKEEDINELVSKSTFDNVFDLTDAVVKRDIKRIMPIYRQLLITNEEPIKIIVILANQFRLIYQTKRLMEKGYSERDIISKLGVHPYRIKLASKVDISPDILLNYLLKLANLDIDIKTGKVNKEVGLEMFFLQL